MKKLISLIVFLAIFMSFSAPVYALTDNTTKLITNSEYDYQITEYVKDNNQLVRTYINYLNVGTLNAQSNGYDLNYEKIKAVLRDLGMSDYFIDMLSAEDLERYQNCKALVGTGSYIKIDENGEQTILDENQALDEIAAQNALIAMMDEDIATQSVVADSEFEDEYMYIYFLVSDLGDGEYFYSVDAEWLTTPKDRDFDSIGVCASKSEVRNFTREGWLSYNERENVGNQYVNNNPVKTEFTSENISSAYNNAWAGAAAVYYLPYDYVTAKTINGVFYDYVDYKYSDIKAHFQCTAFISNTTIQTYFSAVATYDHSVTYLKTQPSISIGADGVSGAIGLEIETKKETRIVELSDVLNYIP